MANKKKPENGEDLIRQYLKDKAAGRSTFDEKSDFQKRVSSGENFGKPYDFGQKKKPAVSEKPKSKPESKAEDKPKSDYASKIAGYYDEYNKKLAEAKRESANEDKTPTKRQSAATGSALSRARESKLLKSEQGNKSATAQGARNKIGENMAKIASGDGKTNADLKLMGQINKLKREYQWEEAGRRYDALSDEEKRERYRKHYSSALDKARANKIIKPGQGGKSATAQETRNQIGENIKDRYYELEKELSDPTKGGEYAFVNRVRSAAGEAAENIGNWLYDSFGYEPGKEVYEKGEARKIGEIASGQFANEMATNPTKSYRTAVQVSDSIANMLSYKIATGPISLFAGSIVSEAAFEKGLAAGVNNGLSLDKAAEEAAKVAVEKGSHAANSIFSGGMAFGTFGDTYNQSRAEGQGKLESTIRATAAGAISYITEAMGGIGGAKSPLNKLESAAKQRWITNLLYNAFEEGGEELVEYSLNYLAQGVIDLAAQGKWNQVYDINVALDNAKTGFWSGGIFGLGNVALSGGQQVVNKLGNNTYTGNAEVDAKLDRSKTELLDTLKTGYQASQDPVVKAKVESQLDATIPDTIQQAPTSPAESVSSEAGNMQAEAQTQQEAPAQAEQKAPKKKPSKKEAKHEEMLDQLDVRAAEKKAPEKRTSSAQKTIETVKNSDITIERKLQRLKNLYNGSEGAEKEAYKQAYTELFNEKKAAQEAAAQQEAETTAQPKQEAPQQVQKPAEGNNVPKAETPKKAAQSGAQLKADRDTVKRAYKDFSNTSMKQSRFEALYNEAYNAESFEAFTKKHPSFGEKLKGAMQKAFENGQRAREGANAKAFSDNGMIMNEDDAFLLNSRNNVDSLIARYKEEADSGMYWDEAYNGDAVQLRLDESEIAARREAVKKLEAYRDENFSQKTEQKTEKQAPKQEKSEKKPASTEGKLEKTIQTLENYKKHLENGDMAKLEQKNPDRYSEKMYKLERMTADENGSDYFGDADEVSVLIDKYKAKLELARAQNGAQAENVGAQTENVGAQTEVKAEKPDAQAKKSGAQKSAAKVQQISENAAKAQQDEYSPEYQKGTEHPETVGAMESDRQNITRAINENGALPQKKKPFSDFDRYKADNDIPSGERAALARKINDPMLGEITVAQNIANLAKDGAKFIEQDGKYYAQNKDGSSVRVSKSAYNYGKWLNDNGVHYTLNQNAEVPKKINGRYVSKSVTTFIASRGGTDTIVESIVAGIERGQEGFTYERKTHSHDIQYAMDTIREKGFDGAVEFFEEMANGDHRFTVELIALGTMLSRIAEDAYVDSKYKNKDAHELSVQILVWMGSRATDAGQVSESMKIAREIVENSSEMYYERLVESLQEKYQKRLKGKEITLDAELLRKVAETAGTKKYTKWADKLNASIANQIPLSWGERITAYAYFSMLSSGRTQMKNIISNAAMFTMVVQKNLWLSVAERIYKKKHPEYMLTTSGFKTNLKDARFTGKIADITDMGNSKYDSEGGFVKSNKKNTFQGNGKLSKINVPGIILDLWNNTSTKLLSAEDNVAKKQLFINRATQFMIANHLTPEFLSDKTNPDAIRAYETMRSIAIEEAMKGTFNNPNAIVPVITAYKNMKATDSAGKVRKAVVGAFIEINGRFKNVPANIVSTAFRYSPAGLASTLILDFPALKKGEIDARVALENAAKGVTGTTTSLGAMILAYLGFLTVGRDEDEDKPIDEKKDTTMYLKIPDKKNGDLYIDIDWIDSVSMQYRFGLELKNMFDGWSKAHKEGEVFDFLGSLGGLLTRSFDTLTNLGIMQSFKNILLNKSGADDATDLVTNILANAAAQIVPQGLKDWRQAFDSEKRNAYYYDKNDERPKWLQLIFNQNKLGYGDRSELPARLDEWGNSLVEQNKIKRMFESVISPFKTYRANDDKVQEMLDQLDAKTDKNVFPPDYPKFITVNGEKVNLSGKEYEEVARKIGKERYKLLDELRKDREFQKLSPDEKAELIQDCYNIANEMAKYGFDDDYSISKITRDVQDAKKEKLSIPKYLRAKQAYDNMSEYEKDGVKISRSYQFADYLMKDTSTTVQEDIKLIELIERKKDGNEYKSPFENIRKVPDTSDKEMLSLYVAYKDDADKQADLDSYMLEYGYNSEQALARYNVGKGSKATYDSLSPKQQTKADKLLADANEGKTQNKWDKDKIALAASAVTSVGSFGTKKTLKSYIAMLAAVGFTESEAKEFYKYYA